MSRNLFLISLILVLGLAANSVLGEVLVQDDFEAEAINLDVWQLVNGPDVSITQGGGAVYFDRPETQLNYLETVEQFNPAETPIVITGSALTGPEGLAIWTRASVIANTGGGPGHVLDNGIRIPLWPEGEASGWYDVEIIRKDPGVWGWTGLTADNIPGEKAYDWDFVVIDDGTTITATFTQTSDPTNTVTVTATDTAQYEANHVAFTVINGYLNDVTIEELPPATTESFSLGATGDIELGNDNQVGPDSSSNGSGLGARDIPARRRVILISYDISELEGPVSNVSLNNFSHDQHNEVVVYGVIEDLDLLDVESLTWNTAPGVMNDPTPELEAPVALDMADLTEALLTFEGPGETGVRFSTDASEALADFINSDTDGILTLLIAASAEENQMIVRSREHSAGGTLLEGEVPLLVEIPVENASFELPGTEKIKGWNGEGVGGTPAEDIPGWSSDSEVADSGVETGWGATDGEWTAFLMGGDPSVWQLTSYVIGADDVIEMKVDSKNNWQATTVQLVLYYDDNGVRIPAAIADGELTDEMQEFSVVLNAADAPDAVGALLGIEINNVTEASDSWLAIDNVRLTLQ